MERTWQSCGINPAAAPHQVTSRCLCGAEATGPCRPPVSPGRGCSLRGRPAGHLWRAGHSSPSWHMVPGDAEAGLPLGSQMGWTPGWAIHQRIWGSSCMTVMVASPSAIHAPIQLLGYASPTKFSSIFAQLLPICSRIQQKLVSAFTRNPSLSYVRVLMSMRKESSPAGATAADRARGPPE